MGINFSSWRTILCILLVLMLAKGNSGRRITGIQWKEMDDDADDLQQHLDDLQQHSRDSNPLIEKSSDDHQKHANANLSSQMDHMDPALNIFFTMNDLKVGKTMPIYFSNKDPSTSPHLLSREETNSIPFSLSQLSYLLDFFSFSKESSQAKLMEYTLTQCELEPMKGETKFCATSLESMLDFARATFGLNTHLKAITTNHLTKPITPLQNYTILEEPKETLAPKMIGCHTMPYPYVVYYCHSHSGNRLFEILLGGENGERVQAASICHMDTSQWDHDNLSFRLLKIEPGTSPLCHFFPADHIIWVPSLV